MLRREKRYSRAIWLGESWGRHRGSSTGACFIRYDRWRSKVLLLELLVSLWVINVFRLPLSWFSLLVRLGLRTSFAFRLLLPYAMNTRSWVDIIVHGPI